VRLSQTEVSMSERLVWYASYGSNLCQARFMRYITGGRPPGVSHSHGGARDKRPPRADMGLALPHQLYFAGTSKVWNGSPCFVDTDVTPGAFSHARAYLIGWEQFEDIVAQENGRLSVPIELGPDDLAPGLTHQLGSRRYENVLCLGPFDGVPVLSLTSPWSMSSAEIDAPSIAYLKVLITGLREVHGLPDEEIVAYLGATPGCSEPLVTQAI
jgi:hypothetical protein